MPFNLAQGNFQLPGGGPNAGGSLTLTLSNIGATVIATGAPATVSYTFTFDANGNMPAGALVYGNAELSPPGTFYTSTVKDVNGTLLETRSPVIVGPSAPYVGTLWPDLIVFPPISISAIFPSLTLSFSATPVFDASTTNAFKLTLTGNVTSSTLINPGNGQLIIFEIVQDATGGRTFVWPTNIKNAGVPSNSPNAVSVQAFWFDGTNAYPLSGMMTN